MMRLWRMILAGWLWCAFGMTGVWAIPNSISISGYLANTGDVPVAGNFAFRVTFYATQTTTTQLGFTNGMTDVRSGIFDLAVEPPEALLTLNEAWYTLAIDTNSNGVDANDMFADRFKISSVPFALATKPVDYFAPYTINSTGMRGFTSGNEPHLSVLAFTTPPGGVEFTKLQFEITYVSFGGTVDDRYSVGIYDRNGQLVCQTGVHQVAETEGTAKSFNIAGHLRGSEKYYIGYAVGNYLVSTPSVNLPPVPEGGFVRNVVTNAQLPTSFNPADISKNAGITYISAAFAN